MIEITCIRNRWVGPCACYSQGKTLFSGLRFKRGSDEWYFPHPYQITRRGTGDEAEFTISSVTGIRRFKVGETNLSMSNLVALMKECRCQCEDDNFNQLRVTIEEITATTQLPWRPENPDRLFILINGAGQIRTVNYNISILGLITWAFPLEEGDELWVREL